MHRLRRELAYDDWANGELLSIIERAPAAPRQCGAWLAHVLGAKSLWLARLEERAATLPVWPELGRAELRALFREQQLDWARFIERCDEAQLARTIEYKNTKGEPWTSRVDDVLAHVSLHGAYHRGQIASALRAAGIPPPATDFIHAARTGQLGEE